MHSSGFAHAPITRLLIFSLVSTSILATLSDTKHYLPLSIPHLVRYGQWWRLLTWPLAYLNSSELLSACMTLYQLRLVERLWGSGKFASFLIATLPYTTLLPPLLLLLLRPLTLGALDYVPAGPTAIIFALLAQYHAAIPYTYRYRVAATSSPSPASAAAGGADPAAADDREGILLTSKSLSYLLPGQLALAQLPGSLLPAVVGWVVGYAWRAEVLPWPRRAWRAPGWLLGGEGSAGGARGEVEGMRRRMREEAGEGVAS